MAKFPNLRNISEQEIYDKITRDDGLLKGFISIHQMAEITQTSEETIKVYTRTGKFPKPAHKNFLGTWWWSIEELRKTLLSQIEMRRIRAIKQSTLPIQKSA